MEESTYWLEKAPVYQAIKHMALPMILGMAIGTIYNFTDTLFLGLLRDTSALAAVSLCMPYQSFAMAIADLIGVGASTAIARYLGKHDRDAARSISSFGFWAALFLGIIAAAASFIGQDQILSALGATGTVRTTTRSFFLITGLALPVSILNLALCQIVRSKADSKSAMIGMLGSSIVNIALDPLFIFVLDMGVAGAATATAVANVLAAVYYAIVVARSDEFSLLPRNARITVQQLLEVLKIGGAAAIMSLLMAASSLTFNICAMTYGEDVVAGFGISQSVVQLIELVAMGLYEGIVPLVAAAYGAKNTDRVDEIVRKTARCLAVYILAAGIAVFVLRAPIINLFSTDAGVIHDATAILTAQLFACAFSAASGLITGVFQAEGKGVAANLVSTVRGIAIVPCVFAGEICFGLNGIVWSLLASEVLSFVVCMGTYRMSRKA